MAYTIYRNSKVLKIEQETVTRQRRPQEIVDPTRARSDYSVTTATINGIPASVTIADFRANIKQGDVVSVAVDDKWNIIAIVNHTTGTSGCLTYKSTKFSDYFGILFFISIPAILCFVIARKAFDTVAYHDYGWYIIGFGILLVVLILRGVNKQYSDSRAALKELLRRASH